MNNKIPCGGFYLSDTLGVDENGKLGVNGGEPYKSLVTDGDGNVKWEDSLAYEVTGWKDFALNSIKKEITGFTMPSVGDTVTVKVNGVESVETVKSGEIEGGSYSYIGSTDIAGLFSGTEGWFIADVGADAFGLANPETTVSLFITTPPKIKYEYLPDDLLKSPYPIQIVDFDKFLLSFGFKVFVVDDGDVGTHNFSLSKKKWDEFLNLLSEFKQDTLCVSRTSIVENVKPNAGRPSFTSTQITLDNANAMIFRYNTLDVSYNEETETVTAIKSIIQKKLT